LAANPKPGRSAIDSLGSGTATLVVGTILLLVLNFASRVAVARRLTLTQFGDFNLGLSFAGLIALVALMGLHQAVARTLAEIPDPSVRRRLVRWTAVVTAIAAVVSSVTVYLLAGPTAQIFNPAHPAVLTVVFQMFSVTIGLTLLCTFIASIFQGFEDTIPFAVLNQGVQPAAFLVFVFILFYFHLQLTGALIAWVISNIVTLIALLIYAWRRLHHHLPEVPPAKDLPMGLWVLSLSLWGVTTLMFVTGYVDTLILGVFRPEAQVGIYSALMTLARLILVAATSVTYIFLPVTARLKGEKDYDSIRSTYVTAGRWVMIFTVPMFFVFGLLPGDSLTAVFGATYSSGAEALLVVTAAGLLSVAFGPVNATLGGMAMTRPLLFATAVSAISNIILSFALIPTYGLMGAAVAWSVARVAYPAAGALALYQSHRITPLTRNFVLPLGLSLAIGVPFFILVGYVHHPVWIVFPIYFVGVLIFIGAILLTRSVEEGDLVIVRIAERTLHRRFPRIEGFLQRFAQPGTFPDPKLPSDPLPPR
jgi:O-antigen/teichoic acid export membrane protein